MLKNFDHNNVLHYGVHSLILKNGKNGSGGELCQKILTEEFPAADEVTLLENEFRICSKATGTHIRKAFRKEKKEDHESISLQFIEGTDLRNYLVSASPDLEKKLCLAIDLADALYELQKENIIHRQVQPSNILVESNTDKIYLIDFGHASLGSVFETGISQAHMKAAETLYYIAPEQTGRVNRSIDNRADLYSFGVILYQLFTGELPFESKDALELIYAHVAKSPEHPSTIKPKLPAVISEIILKLLRKNAEDRYQSAYGVKADLEKCLQQYRKQKKIGNFELGSADFSGKLNFPQRLYGREKESRLIADLFNQCREGKNLSLFVSGYSGSGKSALIETLKEPITEANGFFIKGNFEQLSTGVPYSSFAMAFNELTRIVQTSDEAHRLYLKNRLLDELGHSVKVLTEFIPSLEDLVGKLPEAVALKGIEAQNRFNYEIIRFLKAIAGKDHPLVIFIDDLQWADASSLNLLKLIVSNRDLKYIMLIGAYRKNEVSDLHPLVKKLNEIREEEVRMEELDLKDMEFADVHRLVTEALHTRQENISFLSDIIYNKTKGNAFYVWQFLRSVYEERFLWFDFETHHWQWNMELILQMNVSGNVADLMNEYVKRLPPEIFDLLKTASCLGSKFDKKTLSMIRQIDEKRVENLLNISISEGLVIPAGAGYRFAHDRILQSIYSLIPDEEKSELHLSNGKMMTSFLKDSEFQDRIFEVTNQWNLGSAILENKSQRVYLARLNQTSGNKAMSSTDYPKALRYFEHGIRVFKEDDWKNEYDLFLSISNNAAEAAYLSGEYETLDRYVKEIVRNSHSLTDSIKAYELNIKKLIAQNKFDKAVKQGLSLLSKLGIRFPLKTSKLAVAIQLIKAKWILRNKTADDFNDLPEMEDVRLEASMRIMSDITSAAYFAVPNLVPLLVFRMVLLSVKKGLSAKSPFSFAAYGYILSVYLKEIDRGSRFGDIALHLAKKIHADEQIGSIISTSNLFLVHWKKPAEELKADLEKAYKAAIEFGDNEWACYAAHNLVYQHFLMSSPLTQLALKAEALDLQIEKFRQDLILKRLRLFRQAIENFIKEKEDPDVLTGTVYNEAQMDLVDVNKGNEIYFQNLFILKLYLAIVFNKYEEARSYVTYAERFQENVSGTSLAPLLFFFRTLAISDPSVNNKVNRKVLRQIKKDIRTVKNFEKISPKYNTHRVLLMEAEYYYMKGQMETVKICYDKALKKATEHGMVMDIALIWERAGQFFINTRQEILATFYLQNAFRVYKRWGAEAKLKQMEIRYPQVKKASSLMDWKQDLQSDATKEKAGNLDLETVLKASSAISGEIVLEKLLRKMMQIISESAGAQSGFLIMEKQGERFIEASIFENSQNLKVMQSIPVKKSGLLAESVINYVYLSKEIVILDNAQESQLFGNDEFIRSDQSKSVLCIPLMNMGKLQAVIYLSNNLTYGAFTENRVALLKLLAAQMAISIENALFYSELEAKVEERTTELQLEKKKSDDLLLNILPEEIAHELKQTGRTTPRSYEVATVMFTDFANFTIKSERLTPVELVSVIDTCFKKFDAIISKYRIEKIKTIGDAYLCVSGLPDTTDHNAANVAKAALEILDVIRNLKVNDEENLFFDIRIGIHTGPLVAGVVGDKKFAYDIWGDTVNTAARMEQNSEPNRVNLSQSTYDLIKDQFTCTPRGKIAAKNKGMIDMYFLEQEK